MVYHIYCDESRQSKDRFMVIGGLIIDAAEIERFTQTMRKFRDEQKMFAELKWTKVTDQKLPEYKRFVDYFFALNNTDILHFHCIIGQSPGEPPQVQQGRQGTGILQVLLPTIAA